MLLNNHKIHIVKSKFKEILSSIADSPRIVTTTDWFSFMRLSNDRFEILPVNDLLPKTQFYEIYRSYQLRNIFVPIFIFGLKDEFDRIIRLLSETGLAKKFELQPGYIKYLVCSSERVDRYSVNDFNSWDDPFTYTSHKSACVSCGISSKTSAYILRKDYDEYIHRETRDMETLRQMKETGIFESQKSKYLDMFSKLEDSNKVIAAEDHVLFSPNYFQQLPQREYRILTITELLAADNFSFQLRNILVPIVAFGQHRELVRVVTLLEEMGLAKKFELKPGYFKYLVKESEVTSNRFADPVLLFYGDRARCFSFLDGISITILIKDYYEYFLRRKNAEKSLWSLQNYTCQYCGRMAEHIDHITPLSRGGGCEHDNLALSCQKCNLKKHDRTPDEARMQLVSGFPEIDSKWTASSEQYFKPEVISSSTVTVKPHPENRYYEIRLQDKTTGEIIFEHLAETKSEAFWKFIERYESINPNYTFNPFGRVDSAMRDVRDLSLQNDEEELKDNLEPLKTKLIEYLKKPSQTFPALDVYAALIHEIAFSEKPDLNVFCCSICKNSGVLLADVSFYFYTKSQQEHFDQLNTVICETCTKEFIERKKIKMGLYWTDIVIGNKWHTLESFVKKKIGALRANYIGNMGYWLLHRNLESFELEKLTEYICLLNLCWSQGFKVSSWRPRYKFNIVKFVNTLSEQ